MIYYLQRLQLCFSLFIFLLFMVACNDLERRLNLIEQRVLDETAFGRQMRDYIKSKNTRYILDPSLPYQARYSIVDDSIHYNPKFNPSLKRWKQELLLGRPLNTILKFHEELHRTQVAFSERGAFFQFFRENGRIDEQILSDGKAGYEFAMHVKHGEESKILNFASSLVGYPILDLQKAGEIVRQKMDEMNVFKGEIIVLQEIQAYIGSDIVTDKGIYSQLYETKGKGYEVLPRIEFSEFSKICSSVIQLYGFFEGNHDEVCKIVGKSKSISDFQKKVQSILGSVSSGELNYKVDGWMLVRKEWARGTIKIAKEVLK